MKSLKIFILFSCLLSIASVHAKDDSDTRKNILWIYVEDLSPWIGSYGDKINQESTPTLDKLASDGVLFERCYTPAPVCSATRSALITGAMQTTSGTHNHRSSRDKNTLIQLPKGWKTLPQIFQENGYATFNRGKDDYNFDYKRSELYSVGKKIERKKGVTHSGSGKFSDLPANKPFFIQIQLAGGKSRVKNGAVKAEDIEVPPYFPDTAVFRKWWAHHYNTVRNTDADVKRVLAELEQSGRADNTVVFFFSDHGNNESVRHKQFCYEGGVHVPLIVAGAGLPKNQRRKDLVSGLDISAATLAIAGIESPAWFEGRDLFAKDHQPRKHVISARDRCDYTIDVTRTVRTEKFRYLRNYKTDRIYLQPQYRDPKDYIKQLKSMHKAGKLSELQEKIYFGKRPDHELYNLEKDPFEVNNLATDPNYAETLQQHIAILEKWQKETGDKGMQPESAAGLRAVYNRWKQKCVNPEFAPFKK
jgi:arylsulfatase A-like enzyme